MKKSFFQSPMFLTLILPLVFCVIIIIPSNGYGQRVSLSLSKSGFYPFQNSLYRSQYTPPFTETSAASQDLVLDAESTSGTSFGIAISMTRRWSVLFRVDWATSSFSGLNEPYAFSLDYVYYWGAFYEPHYVHITQFHDWPETTGDLKHLSFSLNALARFKIIQELTLELSGGLTYFTLKGEASSLCFSEFWLGGHAALFSNHYKMKFSFGPQGTLGGNLCLGIEILVIQPIFMFTGVHVFLSPKIRIIPTFEEILNPKEIIRFHTLSEIESFMNLQPLELNPGRVQLHLGIRLRI